MVSWGIVTICTAAVSSYKGLIICRVFLGAAEAGFFVSPSCSVPPPCCADLPAWHYMLSLLFLQACRACHAHGYILCIDRSSRVSARRRASRDARRGADGAELLVVSLRPVLASYLAKQDSTDGNGCKSDPLICLGRDIGSLTKRFILEGIPAVIVGVLIWFYLPDYPETAKFFSQEEKDFCARRMGPYAPKGK
jgi:hypothetical protein